MGSRPERGAYGNARGKKPKNVRRKARLEKPRVAKALAQVRAHEALLDAVADASTGPGRTKLVYAKPETIETPLPARLRSVSAPKSGPRRISVDWCLRDAILMLRQGYRPEHVAWRTGYDMEIITSLVEEADP